MVARVRCRMSGGAAAEMVTTAQQLEELPDTAPALRDGVIGYQHASVIAHAARDLGDERVREAVPILVEAARSLDVRRLHEVTLRLRECLDPDGAPPPGRPAAAGRWPAAPPVGDGVGGDSAASPARRAATCAGRVPWWASWPGAWPAMPPAPA